jgi:hypothetical protein
MTIPLALTREFAGFLELERALALSHQLLMLLRVSPSRMKTCAFSSRQYAWSAVCECVAVTALPDPWFHKKHYANH